MLGEEFTYDVERKEVVLEELVEFEEDEKEEDFTISEGNGNME